ERGKADAQDTVVLGHHDPRGGHRGKDLGYYFEQLDYEGLGQSAYNYVHSEAITPVLCKLPSWALSAGQEKDCLHDGLAEWMRADEEFDCDDADRLPDGRCNPALFDTRLPAGQRHRLHYSGYDLIDKLATRGNVRTLLLGHTHYN